MESILYNQKGENIGSINLPKEVFGVKVSDDLIFQIVTSLQSNKRQVIAHTKGRGEVRGGGKKPWRQKGTGRARHGSIRSPIWKGGGVTHGPSKDKDYSKKITKKMAQKALQGVLSGKFKDGQVLVVDTINPEKSKTKDMALIVKNLSRVFDSNRGASMLLTLGENNKNINIVSRNLKDLSVIEARNINPLEILKHKYLVVTQDAVDVLAKKFSK